MTEDQVPNRALLQQRFEQYEALAEALCRQANRPETVRRLERLRARLRQGPVRLLVVGVSCAGKSTLINALAGEFVAPEGDYVTSCVPLWVSGRRPDPQDDKPRFDALCWNKDGSLHIVHYNQINALGELCHAPNYEIQVPEDLEAMTAQVSGGFLWDSGLTLVDTPGIGQQTADDTQTRTAIDRGAELLLIAHRAPTVSDENGSDTELSDAAFLQSLFPGGTQDLHLNMKRDLFLLGNNASGGKGNEAGIQSALKKLVSKWNIYGEKRFYWVNVLRQRQRVGYYHYYDWFPKGADRAPLLIREQEEKQIWERLREAKRRAGEGADEKTQIETEEELTTQALLEQAADETGRENLLRAAPMRKKAALRDSRNMDKLRQALTNRALDLYEDPDRLCAPIEAELRRAAQDLAEDCRRKIGEKTEKIRQEAAGLPDEQLSSEELVRLRERDRELNATIAALARASDWLEGKTLRFIQEQEQEQNNYQDYEAAEATPILLSQFLLYSLGGDRIDVSTDAKAVKDGTWYQEIVKPLTGEYIRRRSRVQTGLADGTAPLPEGWVLPEQWIQRLDELVRKLNHRLPEGIKRYALSDRLLHPDPAPFLAAAREAAQADAREIEQGLCRRLTDMQMNPPKSMSGKLTSAVLSLMSNGTVFEVKALAEEALGQTSSGISRDVQRYIRYRKDTAAKQQNVLKRIVHELCRQGEELSSQCRQNHSELTEALARVRETMLRRRLKEELAPLEQELEQWETLSRQENWMEVSL